MNLRDLKELIRAGELAEVQAAVDTQPDLLHTRDPDPDSWEELTALHCAARHANLDLVKFLVERGAEVYSNPMNSYPAVFVANGFRHRNPSPRPNGQHVVDYFLTEIPHLAEGTRKLGATINIAAREGWAEIVRKHIELDPLAVFQRGWIGDTPLHWSSHNGHSEIVSMLLDAGADVEADEINCYGGKPLHWASEHEAPIVKLLLERGAKVNSVNERKESEFYGITPLIMNVLMTDDCAEATQLLLDAGADTSVTYRGKTLVEISAEKGNAKILSVLRAAGL